MHLAVDERERDTDARRVRWKVKPTAFVVASSVI